MRFRMITNSIDQHHVTRKLILNLNALYSSSSRIWAITVLTSGKRGVIAQSNGNGCLGGREEVIIGWEI